MTENGKFIVMPYLNKLAVWQRPAQNAKVDCFGDVSIFTANSGPKALVDLIYDKQGTIVFETVISPNGRYLIESTSRGLFIHNMMIASDGRPKIENVLCIAKDDESPITALCSTNSALYFAHGSSVLERINFETLEREIVAIRSEFSFFKFTICTINVNLESDTMLIKITVNPLESHCLALTARSEILLLDLTAKNVDVDVSFIISWKNFVSKLINYFRSVLKRWTFRTFYPPTSNFTLPKMAIRWQFSLFAKKLASSISGISRQRRRQKSILQLANLWENETLLQVQAML